MSPRIKESQRLLRIAKKHLPAETHTFSRGHKCFVDGIYPIFAQSGKGSTFVDVDGNKYIDYMAALGPIILGYSYDAVNKQIKKQIDDGTIFSLPHRLEVESAEMMCKIIPSADMAKFSKTGSDSVTAAVRASRAVTGKNGIAYCGGGGVWHDWFTVITSRNFGIPKSQRNMIKIFEYNNIESLKSLLDNNKEIGTVCMEPMTFEYPKKNFLNMVKKITHEHDALLIFDEVQTGFRWSIGGAEKYFNIKPDLSTWGKAIANGMPLGAITGRSEFMRIFNDVFYSTTFAGEAASLAAFHATVIELEEKDAIKHIHEMGEKFRRQFQKLIYENNAPITIHGFPAKLKLTFDDEKNGDTLLMRSLFCQEMIGRGIFFWQGPLFHTFSHTLDNMKKTLDASYQAIRILERATNAKTMMQMLKGRPMERVMKFPVNKK